MELVQLKTYLADYLSNTFGVDQSTMEPETYDWVDIGKKISEIDENTALSYNKKFVVGVIKNMFDTRSFNIEGLGLFTDSITFTGIIQRVKMGLLETVETHSFNLTKGGKYDRDLYYNGQDTNVRVYDKDTTFTIWYSIPMEDFKQYFTSFEGVQSLVSLIEQRAKDTIAMNVYMLENRTMNKMIIDSLDGGREIKLRSMYNTLHGSNLSVNACLSDYEFLQWSAGVIKEFSKYMELPSKRYNNGEIESFTPKSDLRMLLLARFDTALSTHMYSATFNDEYVKLDNHKSIAFWQNPGDVENSNTALPLFTDISNIKIPNSEEGEDPVDYSNIVGVIYDNRGIGVTAIPIGTRASYNGDGGFNNIYQDIRARYFIDPRDTSVVLTLN